MEQQNDKNPKIACIIALICLLAPIIFALILTGVWGYLSQTGMYWSLIIEVVLLAASLLWRMPYLIVSKKKYPQLKPCVSCMQ